jgi:hypothetical protein
MPDNATRGFGQALTEIVRRLETAKNGGLLRGYGLIGGFAAAAWGVPRATHDIDFVLVAGSTDHREIAEAIGAQFRAGDPSDPLRGVFHLTIDTKGQVIPIQLILLPTRWTDAVLNGLQTLPILDCSVPVVSWPTLVLLKLYAGSPQDLTDAETVLAVRQPKPEEIREMTSLAGAVGVSPELATLVRRLEHMGLST